ncbi:MAG: hypothetical protein IMZ71_04610 [Chloroflexi bacterium]|nr:hypothetical protein [Chloroflexota bacterium]
MANKMRYLRGPEVEAYIAKSGTVSIDEGDLLKINSAGAITPASTSGDYTGLVAVAKGASPTTDPSGAKVPVYLIGFGTVFEFICGTTTVAFPFGYPMKITGKQTLSKKTATSITKSATTAVAVVAEGMAVSGSSVKVIFKQSKLFSQIGRKLSGAVGTW